MDIGSIILFVEDMRAVTAFCRDVVGLHPDAALPCTPLFPL